MNKTLFCFISLLIIIALPASAALDIVWEQTNGPFGEQIFTLFTASDGKIYAGVQKGVFRCRR